MAVREFQVLVEEDETGFVADCPAFPGCYAQGETYDEVLANIRDVIRLHLERTREGLETMRNLRGLALRTVAVDA